MNRWGAFAALVAGSLFLAGCSLSQSGTMPAAAPPATQNLVAGSQAAASGLPIGRVVRIDDDVAHRGRPAKAHIMLKIPMKRRHGGMTPEYISASTKSLVVTVDGGNRQVFDITYSYPQPPSAPCQATGTTSAPRPHRSYLTLICQFSVKTTAGAHVFSFATYDQTGGKGHPLSAYQNKPFTVVYGSNEPLALTLGGIPYTATLSWSGWRGVPLDGKTAIYGRPPFSFYLDADDADFNYIIGPGAPTIVASLSSGAKATLTPPTGSYQPWTLTPNYVPVNPTVPSPLTLTVTIQPVAHTGAQTIYVPFPVELYEPWLYVMNQQTSTVGTTDEYGVEQTLTAPYPWSGIPDPSGVAYDTANKWLYVPSIDDDMMCLYTLMGADLTSSGGWSNLNGPTGLTYVPATSSGDRFYVANNNYCSECTRPRPAHRPDRRAHARPFAGVGGPGPVTAYDATGKQVVLAGTFSGLSGARGIVYDSHNGELYVTDNSNDAVYAFTLDGTPAAGWNPSLPAVSYGGISYNPISNWLYAVDQTDGTVVVFDETGALVTTYSGFTSPNDVLFDPHNGYTYVSEGGSANDVVSVDEYGARTSTIIPSVGSSPNPWGMAVVP